MHYFSLFDTDGEAEDVACIRELVDAALLLNLRLGSSRQQTESLW